MATQILYKIGKNGLFLNSSGSLVLESTGESALFNSLPEVEAFIEASASIDTYSIHIISTKS